MGPGIVLLFTLLFVILVLKSFLIWTKRRSKRHLESFEKDWNSFKLALTEDNIENIRKYGLKIVWNVHLKPKYLKALSESVDSRINDHPELKELENAIFNKKLHWERHLPYSQ
jgi:hypothetical protein